MAKRSDRRGEKPMITMAFGAVASFGTPRAISIMARSLRAPPEEAEDTFAVLTPCLALTMPVDSRDRSTYM